MATDLTDVEGRPGRGERKLGQKVNASALQERERKSDLRELEGLGAGGQSEKIREALRGLRRRQETTSLGGLAGSEGCGCKEEEEESRPEGCLNRLLGHHWPAGSGLAGWRPKSEGAVCCLQSPGEKGRCEGCSGVLVAAGESLPSAIRHLIAVGGSAGAPSQAAPAASPVCYYWNGAFWRSLGRRACLLKLGRKAQLLLPPGLEEIVALPVSPVIDFSVGSCHQSSSN